MQMPHVLFFGLTVGWLALPFLPALIELLKGRDVKPLRVVTSSEVDIRHFAKGCRRLVNTILDEDLEACRREGAPRDVDLPEGGRARILPGGSLAELDGVEARAGYTQRLFLSPEDLQLQPDASYLGEIFVKGDLRGGERDILRAALAEGDMVLAPGTISLRWLHADGEFRAEEDCALYGRVSTDRAMRLGVHCHFERLNAPKVLCAEAENPPAPPDSRERQRLAPEDLPGFVDLAGGRCLVRGDLELPPHSLLRTNLVVTGALHVGEGCEIDGDVKARRKLHLDRGVTVTGALVSGRELDVEAYCRLGGPVLAERDLSLGSCCRVGHPDRPTTLCGDHLRLRPGTILHGSVRARFHGEILPAASAPAEEVDPA